LIEQYRVQGLLPWHQSSVYDGASKRIEISARGISETFPAQYWPGHDPCDHLAFALKYDGTDLALLAKLLPAIGADSITRWVQATPQGKYTRRIWYLFELLTGQRLLLADMTAGNYVDLLERDEYFVLDTPTQVRRQRINDNLLGNGDFCPDCAADCGDLRLHRARPVRPQPRTHVRIFARFAQARDELLVREGDQVFLRD
jgi:hypothetical protein